MQDTMNDRFRYARIKSKLSSHQLANILSIDPVELRCMEDGELMIPRRNILQICKVLGITRKWLLEGKCNETA